MRISLKNVTKDLIQRKSEDYEYWKNEENAKRLAFYVRQKPRISRVIDMLAGTVYLLVSIIFLLVFSHLMEGTYILQREGFSALSTTIIIENLIFVNIAFAVLALGMRFVKDHYFSIETFGGSFFCSFIFVIGILDTEAYKLFIPLLIIKLLKIFTQLLWARIDFCERIADGRISKV